MKKTIVVYLMLVVSTQVMSQVTVNPEIESTTNPNSTLDSNWNFRGHAKVATDIRDRGISNSFNGPAAQLTVEILHSSGGFSELELTTVSKKQYPSGKGIRLQAAVGYRWGDPDAVRYEVGAVTYGYPGNSTSGVSKYDVISDPDTGDVVDIIPELVKIKPTTAELYVKASYQGLSIRYLNTVSKNFNGISSPVVCASIAEIAASYDCLQSGNLTSRGSSYLEIEYAWRISKASTVTFQVGYQKVKNFRDFDFYSYSAQWKQTVSQFDLIVGLAGAKARNVESYRVQFDGTSRNADKPTLYLSVGRSF